MQQDFQRFSRHWRLGQAEAVSRGLPRREPVVPNRWRVFDLFPTDIALPVNHLIVQVRNGVVRTNSSGTTAKYLRLS